MSAKELGIAVSTVWVLIAAVLVMFMQAGFAFLEAGLTRMKNVGHIAAKNVLIFALASIVYYLVGFAIAFGDGGNGFMGSCAAAPSVDELLAVGAEPFSWFGAIPAAAGYMFEVVFCAVSLAIVWGAMAERTKLWVYFAFGIVFTIIYSIASHWIWSPEGWLFDAGHAGLRRLDRRALSGSSRRPRRGDPARAASREVRRGRQAERDPRSQHGLRHARRDHPLVRLVRLQRRLDAERRLRRRRVLRLCRPEHEPRGGGRRARSGRHLVARDQEARPVDDAERRHRGARRDHGGVRVRRPLGRDPDRLRRRRDRRPWASLWSRRSGSTTRSARSQRTAWRASGGRCRLGFLTVPALAEKLATGSGGLLYGGGPHQLGVQALGLAAVGAFTFTASFLVLWLFKATFGIRTEPRSSRPGWTSPSTACGATPSSTSRFPVGMART